MLFDSPVFRMKNNLLHYVFVSSLTVGESKQKEKERERWMGWEHGIASWLEREPMATTQVKFQLYDIIGFF